MMWQISIFGDGGIDPTTINAESFIMIVLRAFSASFIILSAICTVYIIMAGIQYVMAAGNAGEQSNAKKTITYALLGLVVALLSFVLVGEILRRLSFNATV